MWLPWSLAPFLPNSPARLSDRLTELAGDSQLMACKILIGRVGMRSSVNRFVNEHFWGVSFRPTQRSTGYPSSGPDQITHGFKQLKHISHRPHLVHPKMRGLEVFELSRFLLFFSTGNKDLAKNWLWTAFLSCCVLGESSSSEKEDFQNLIMLFQ